MNCSAVVRGAIVNKLYWLVVFSFVLSNLSGRTASGQIPLLSSGDAVIAINAAGKGGGSNYPGGEPPANAIDGLLTTKYLNFGHKGSGFIVTPSAAEAVESFVITTANDAPLRDPTTWELYGYNGALVSADNSTGLDETWTLIDSGAVVLPEERDTVGPVVPVASGGVGYEHYKMIYPTLKDEAGGGSDTNSMQINEVQFYQDAGATAGQEILAPGDPVLGIRYGDLSRYPTAEGPANLLDENRDSKYLNFGKENSGAIITLSGLSATVESLQLTTANDAPGRDPASYELWGTNDAIVSEINSDGLGGEAWTLISSGDLSLPEERLDDTTLVAIDADTAYQSYKLIFPTLKDAENVDSLQIGGVQLFGTPVPEPASLVLALGLGGAWFAAARRRRCQK